MEYFKIRFKGPPEAIRNFKALIDAGALTELANLPIAGASLNDDPETLVDRALESKLLPLSSQALLIKSAGSTSDIRSDSVSFPLVCLSINRLVSREAGTRFDMLHGEGIKAQVTMGENQQRFPIRIHGPRLETILKDKEAERDRLEDDVARRQVELDTIKQEILAFDVLFIREVGVLMVDLLNLKAVRLRERLADDPTFEPIAKAAYEEARQKQQEVYGDAFIKQNPDWTSWEVFRRQTGLENNATVEPPQPTSWEAEGFTEGGELNRDHPRFKELQKLQRKIVKKLHPDRVIAGGDQVEIERCTKFLARVNLAFARGDLEELRVIEAEWDSGGFSKTVSEGLRAQLKQILKEIKRLQQHLAQLNEEIGHQKASVIYQLIQRLKTEGQSVSDYFAPQVIAAEEQIQQLLDELRRLRREARGKGEG